MVEIDGGQMRRKVQQGCFGVMSVLEPMEGKVKVDNTFPRSSSVVVGVIKTCNSLPLFLHPAYVFEVQVQDVSYEYE